MMKRWSLVAVLLASDAAFAGGWSGSGGGSISGDANNPWFVANTTDVNWCLELDEDTFGVSRPAAVEQIEAILGYWRANFANTSDNLGDGGDDLPGGTPYF